MIVIVVAVVVVEKKKKAMSYFLTFNEKKNCRENLGCHFIFCTAANFCQFTTKLGLSGNYNYKETINDKCITLRNIQF